MIVINTTLDKWINCHVLNYFHWGMIAIDAGTGSLTLNIMVELNGHWTEEVYNRVNFLGNIDRVGDK